VGSNLARVLGYQDFIHFNADLCDLNRIVMYCVYLSEINVKKLSLMLLNALLLSTTVNALF
jgi:hypothetical protein